MQKEQYKPRMIRQGPGSLNWIPERLRVPFKPRHSRTDAAYLKTWGSRPETKKAAVRGN